MTTWVPTTISPNEHIWRIALNYSWSYSITDILSLCKLLTLYPCTREPIIAHFSRTSGQKGCQLPRNKDNRGARIYRDSLIPDVICLEFTLQFRGVFELALTYRLNTTPSQGIRHTAESVSLVYLSEMACRVAVLGTEVSARCVLLEDGFPPFFQPSVRAWSFQVVKQRLD